jgi:hypothetical protein
MFAINLYLKEKYGVLSRSENGGQQRPGFLCQISCLFYGWCYEENENEKLQEMLMRHICLFLKLFLWKKYKIR